MRLTKKILSFAAIVASLFLVSSCSRADKGYKAIKKDLISRYSSLAHSKNGCIMVRSCEAVANNDLFVYELDVDPTAYHTSQKFVFSFQYERVYYEFNRSSSYLNLLYSGIDEAGSMSYTEASKYYDKMRWYDQTYEVIKDVEVIYDEGRNPNP